MSTATVSVARLEKRLSSMIAKREATRATESNQTHEINLIREQLRTAKADAKLNAKPGRSARKSNAASHGPAIAGSTAPCFGTMSNHND